MRKCPETTEGGREAFGERRGEETKPKDEIFAGNKKATPNPACFQKGQSKERKDPPFT